MKTGSTKLRFGSLLLCTFLAVALLGTLEVAEGLHCQVCVNYDGEAEADECSHPAPCNTPEDVKAAKDKVDFTATELVKKLEPSQPGAASGSGGAAKATRKRREEASPETKPAGPEKFVCLKLKEVKVPGISKAVALATCVVSSSHDPPFEPKNEVQELTNLGSDAISAKGYICDESNEAQCGGKGAAAEGDGLKCPVCAYFFSKQEEGEAKCKAEVDRPCLGPDHASTSDAMLLEALNKIKPPVTTSTTPEPEAPPKETLKGPPAAAASRRRHRHARHTDDEKAEVVCVRFDGKLADGDKDEGVAGSVCLQKSKHDQLAGGKGDKEVTDFPLAEGVVFSGKIRVCDASNTKECAGMLQKHEAPHGGAPKMFAPNPLVVLFLVSLGLAFVAGHVVLGMDIIGSAVQA